MVVKLKREDRKKVKELWNVDWEESGSARRYQAELPSEVTFEYRSQRCKEEHRQLLEEHSCQRSQPAWRPQSRSWSIQARRKMVLNLEFYAEPIANTVLGQNKNMILHMPTLGKFSVHTHICKYIHRDLLEQRETNPEDNMIWKIRNCGSWGWLKWNKINKKKNKTKK